MVLSRGTIPVLRSLAAVVALALAAPAAGQPSAQWSTLPLPGGRATLLPKLGLQPDMPRALVIPSIVRTAHAGRAATSPDLPVLAQHFSEPPAEGDELLPVPLTAEFWRQQVTGNPDDRQLLGALLQDRQAALLCYGLLGVDAATLAALASEPALLSRIRVRYAGTFAAFSSVIRVRDGTLQLPRARTLASFWEQALGVPPGDWPAAVEALLTKDEGRLAYFAAALDGLEPARVRFVVGDPLPDPNAQLERVNAAYSAFRDLEPAWKVNEFPFLRMGFDPPLLAATIRLDAQGQLRGSRAFWEAALGLSSPDALERDLPRAPVDGAWLLQEIARRQYPDRQEAFHAIGYVEREWQRNPEASERGLAARARDLRRFPALLLTLERMGVNDGETIDAAIARAAAIDREARGQADKLTALELFQAPLALLDVIARRRAVDAATAARLVRALAAAGSNAREIAAFIDGELLPALGHTSEIPAESTLLEALAGTIVPATGARQTLDWEGLTYVIDPAAPELVRLTEVRSRQGGNVLDDALELARIGAALAAATDEAAVDAAASRLRHVADQLQPVEPSERAGVPPPPDVAGGISKALAALERGRRGDARRRAQDAARLLAPVEDAVLAAVLTTIVYAQALGEPDSRMFLAGNVARRHDFGLLDRNRRERELTPWYVPWETSGGGQPWHVRGSLLALDVGLARLSLRRTRLDMPGIRPSIGEIDRQAVLTTVALLDARSVDAEGARRLVTWLREGRRRLSTLPANVDEALARLRLDGQRRNAILWTRAEEPADLPRLLLTTEIALLGAPADATPPDGWGLTHRPLTGCLCLRFPDPPELVRYLDRPGGGLLATRVADLMLAVLEGLDELQLPVVLAPGVLQGAAYDFLNETQLAYPDDWWTYSAAARTIRRDRLLDYVAALTAGGPLVPTGNSTPTGR